VKSSPASQASRVNKGGAEPALSAAEANRRYFADRAADYDETEECVTIERHRHRRRRVLTIAVANAQRHERILDACGGSGYASLELGAMGLSAVTVDISLEMLEVYASKAASVGLATTIHVAEIRSFLSESPGRWDLIVFSSALHHLDDYLAVLLAANDRLADGGVIVTVFDSISSGRLGYAIRCIDYLLWLALRHPVTFIHRLRRRVTRPITSDVSVGRTAEIHALSGIDDVALARHLEEHGLEIVLHERDFEARVSVVRVLGRILSRPSTFSFIVRRPAHV
jgi:ubiquinone/menaquinone biosynthesis C-methylase UbiE